MREFDRLVREMTAGSGWRGLKSGREFVDAWRSFVGQCAAGYDMSIYEYENDLSIRTEIQRLLNDPQLRQVEGYDEFYALISSIDRDFKTLLQEGVEIGTAGGQWWIGGVLRHAKEELAEDFMDIHGVRVRVV